MDLPSQIATDSGIRKLSVCYSKTQIGERPQWQKFKHAIRYTTGEVRFLNDDDESSNSVAVLAEDLMIVLSLRHFCTFAIVVNELQEQRQSDKMASVDAFVKTFTDHKSLIVDILLLVGCNEMAMVSFHCSVRLDFHFILVLFEIRFVSLKLQSCIGFMFKSFSHLAVVSLAFSYIAIELLAFHDLCRYRIFLI
jgi:hypothetical protein